MELKCPQCGKWMAVSREELLMHDSQVVCPQCLAVCRYENDTLVVRDDSDAPYRHTASVTEAPHASTRYCYSCGKQLPEGIRFCPYCGADLEAPFDKTQPAPEPAPKPVEKTRTEQREEKKQAPAATEPRPTAHVEDKLRTINHRYSGSAMPLHQRGTMPSTGFKIVAYSLIVLLLILLVLIIKAGLNIESAM